MTIGLVILLLETLRQDLQTISTGKMIRMELPKHGCGAFTNDRLLTNGT